MGLVCGRDCRCLRRVSLRRRYQIPGPFETTSWSPLARGRVEPDGMGGVDHGEREKWNSSIGAIPPILAVLLASCKRECGFVFPLVPDD